MSKNLIECAQNRKKGDTCSKYISNLRAYEKEFSEFLKRDKFKILEIGVSGGGSLWMWREYFPNAIIHGIDDDSRYGTNCKQWEDTDENIFVHIGSQTDGNFLTKVIEEHGPFDIIIDDGGHRMEQQQFSFKHLWPSLNEGGVYVIEDLHTSYYERHGGGVQMMHNIASQSSTLSFLKSLVDKLHWWAIPNKTKDIYDETVSELHFYDSMCFLHKDSDRIICSKDTLTDEYRKRYLNE